MTTSPRNCASLFFILTLLSTWEQAASGAEKQRKFDLVVRSEITINRPVKEVWPHFIDMGTWMTEVRFQNIGGKSGEEGEIRLVRPAKDVSASGYSIKTVRITPFKQYVVKVVSESPVFNGFGDFSFTETAGKTHMVYDIYVEFLVPEMSEEKFRELSAEHQSNSIKRMAENNNRLKLLIENE